jgi:hypothetical protein
MTIKQEIHMFDIMWHVHDFNLKSVRHQVTCVR